VEKRRQQYFDAVYRAELSVLKALLDEDAADRGPHVIAGPLRTAVASNANDIVDAFLDGGVDPNVRDRDSSTPLMWAAEAGNLRLVNRLLAMGGEPDAVDHVGMTPLLYAAFHQHLIIAQRLVAAGANPAHRNCEARSAVDLARLRRFQFRLPRILGFGSIGGVYRGLRRTATEAFLDAATYREHL
jgi:ankyrin repeat protein